MKKINVYDVPLEYDPEDPEGYKGGAFNFKAAIGARTMTGKIFELPPGQALCPYHWEKIGPGDLVAFPAGPEGAHKTTTVGDETARFVFLSTHNLPAVAFYPDSEKIGVWTGDPAMHVMVRRGENLDYYDGET
jgi:uncharacterized cupin superfamily protein